MTQIFDFQENGRFSLEWPRQLTGNHSSRRYRCSKCGGRNRLANTYVRMYVSYVGLHPSCANPHKNKKIPNAKKKLNTELTASVFM